MDKEAAHSFFQEMERHLQRELPPPRTIRTEVADEESFLVQCAIPAIYTFVSHQPDMDADKAREVLLAESYRRIRSMASGSPCRSARHPFSKVFGKRAAEIVRQWRGDSTGSKRGDIQSCPDLALRAPFLHKIVFECKYFSRGGNRAAESLLVKGIYQAFFYLGLPFLPAGDNHPAWDYDFACFLAYDNSDDGLLLRAWQSLDRAVRNSCWAGGNIYVLITRGRDQT
jgi:hypothetical protein